MMQLSETHQPKLQHKVARYHDRYSFDLSNATYTKLHKIELATCSALLLLPLYFCRTSARVAEDQVRMTRSRNETRFVSTDLAPRSQACCRTYGGAAS